MGTTALAAVVVKIFNSMHMLVDGRIQAEHLFWQGLTC